MLRVALGTIAAVFGLLYLELKRLSRGIRGSRRGRLVQEPASPSPSSTLPTYVRSVKGIQRLPSLTSLRWVAASVVFLRHGGELLHSSGYDRIADQGAVGVSFFFLLSGFVLAWAHRRGNTLTGFYRRRFARIVPAYWVMALVAIPVLLWLGAGFWPLQMVRWIFPLSLLQAWVPRPDVYFGGNGVNWSLSVEVFFYALFPFIVQPIFDLSPVRRRQLLVGLFIVAILVPLASHTQQENSGFLFWLIYINPLIRLVEFTIGICLCSFLREGSGPKISPMAAGVLAVAAYLGAGWVPIYMMWVATTVVPFALLIWACAQADLEDRTPRFLRSPILVRLGQWSFAFYLVHQLVVEVVAKTFNDLSFPIAGQAGLLMGTYAAATAAAYLLFTYIEYPLEQRIRKGGSATPPSEIATVS
jgi:peptidoglycan/LPS O-acetylase OafA/YrhL